MRARESTVGICILTEKPRFSSSSAVRYVLWRDEGCVRSLNVKKCTVIMQHYIQMLFHAKKDAALVSGII